MLASAMPRGKACSLFRSIRVPIWVMEAAHVLQKQAGSLQPPSSMVRQRQ